MSDQTQDFEEWLNSLYPEEVNVIMNELELDLSGSIFQQAARLYKRLNGDYTADDFIAIEESEAALTRTRRDNNLIKIIATSTMQEKTKRKIFQQIEEKHRKETEHRETEEYLQSMSLTDPVESMARYHNKTGIELINLSIAEREMNVAAPLANSTCTNSPVPQTLTTFTATTNSCVQTTASGMCRTQARIESRHIETMSHNNDGNSNRLDEGSGEFTHTQRETPNMQEQVLAILSKMQQQINYLMEAHKNTEAQKEQKREKVYFQDTIDLKYIDAANPALRNIPSSSKLPVQQTPCHPRHQGPGGGGGTHIAENVSGSPPYYTRATMSGSLSQRTDVGKTVRQWKVHFNGSKGSSIEEFLQRVAECRRLTPLTDEDMLDALTELLQGVALQWYRQSRKNWLTWQDFCEAARSCFGVDRRFQARLEDEAQKRTQGRGEPTRNYVFRLLTMLSRFQEPWSTEKQLDLIYKNLTPEIQKMVPREKITSIQHLIELAREAECILETERNYRPPAAPEDTLMPELACPPEEAHITRSKPRISAVEPVDLKNIVREVLREMGSHDKLPSRPKASEISAVTPKDESSDFRKKQSPTRSPKSRSDSKKSTSPNWKRKTFRKPLSDRNKDKERGPLEKLLCWGCSWPGHTMRTCPNCSGNAKQGE